MAKRIGEEIEHKSPETLFLMGIIHDIGKILLIKAILDMNPEEIFEKDLWVAIHEIHTTFGAALLKRMRFSEAFVQIAEFHHWNDFSKNEDKELMVIHLSDILAEQAGYGFFDDTAFDEKKMDGEDFLTEIHYLPDLGMKKEDIKALADDVKERIKTSIKSL